MNLQLTFKKRLTIDETRYYNEMVLDNPYGSIYQSTHWVDIHSPEYTDKIFFWDGERPDLVAGVLLIHKKHILRFAEIKFGPVVKDLSRLVEIVDSLIAYTKRHFHWLKISLPYPISNETEILERMSLKKHNMKFDLHGSNWSTLVIKLDRSLDEIFQSFRQSHKRYVKKARTIFQVRLAKDEKDLRNFAKVYNDMWLQRGYKQNCNLIIERICCLGEFLRTTQKGFVYLVYNDSDLVGGTIFIRSGRRLIYLIGASAPQWRKDPVTYLAFWLAIQDAHTLEGVDIFDLGGYNIFVGKEDQVYNINHFKYGFSKCLEFFPKTQYYVFSPLHYFLYKNPSATLGLHPKDF